MLDVQCTLTLGSVELSTELRVSTVRARATDDYLTLTGGTQGTYLKSALYTASAIRADNSIVVQGRGDLQVIVAMSRRRS